MLRDRPSLPEERVQLISARARGGARAARVSASKKHNHTRERTRKEDTHNLV